MNAPKNRPPTTRNSQIASLLLLTPVLVVVAVVLGVRRRRRRPRSGGDDGLRHQCASVGVGSGSVDGSIAQPVSPKNADDDADREQPPVLEHEAVAHDRQAEREDERPVRRRRHVDAVRLDADRGCGRHRRRATGGQLHQPALVVLGVLAVPELVAVRDDRDLREVVLGRRRRGRSTRASARPTGRRPHSSPRRAVKMTFTRNTSTDNAMMNAPIVAMQVERVPAHARSGTCTCGGAGPRSRGSASGRT